MNDEVRAKLLLDEEKLKEELQKIEKRVRELGESWSRLADYLTDKDKLLKLGFSGSDYKRAPNILGLGEPVSYPEYERNNIEVIKNLVQEYQHKFVALHQVKSKLGKEQGARRINY